MKKSLIVLLTVIDHISVSHSIVTSGNSSMTSL